MVEKISSHFILMKWKGSLNEEVKVEGYKIVTIEEYYKWSSTLELVSEEISLELLGGSVIPYINGTSLLKDISCEVVTSKEVDLISKFIGRDYGEDSFWNYRFIRV